MNKAQFVELVQENGSYKTKVEAEAAINALVESFTQVLEKKDEISLVGFGSFSAAFQKGKSGKVPGTDKTYTSEDKYVAKFKPGKGLKDRIVAGK